ncbi:hypothetical protein C1H46_026338 [Malus baccata]|uniref:Uncharacterized protein n=1 Tax=Malus baccata TaxID=106549 RepID=A0A540LNR7_MALBA|nr:hypothetical protein C1H46_026338 [Malus baccata]
MILSSDAAARSCGRARTGGRRCPTRPSHRQRKKMEGIRVKVEGDSVRGRQKEAEKVGGDGDAIAIDGGSGLQE